MSKVKKIVESFIDNLFRRTLLRGFNISTKRLAKMLAEEVADEMKYGEVTEKYLYEYTTKELIELIDKTQSNDGLTKEDKGELLINIVIVIFQRHRQWMAVTGNSNLKPSPEEVDMALNPPKPPKQRPKILPESRFKIDNWDELLIVITDGDDRIMFKKLFDGKPSEESAYTMRYSELGFGQSAIQFLELCATKNKTGSFVSTNRKLKSNVDKALREHFNMGENQSIISHQKKAHNYYPLFSIWHYDKDRNSIYGSMY